MGENLKCTVLSGPMAKSGGFTLIPRVRFEYGRKSDDTNIDRFVRVQFPVIPAFAMTINKAQGQALQRVGLHLGTQVFSHGQIYTGFSRVTSREGIRIFNDRPKRPNFIINRVYEQLLDKLSARTPSPSVPESQRIDRDQWPVVPGIDATRPSSWAQNTTTVWQSVDAAQQEENAMIAENPNAGDDEEAIFTDGRAPEIFAYQDTDNEFDWDGMGFDLDAPTVAQPPNRNAFNHFFPDADEVDVPALDQHPPVSFKITLIKADITKLQVDAIVNAANAQLREGGGVCGAIFKAAGSAELQRECDLYDGCTTGNAVMTGAYGLSNVRNIIHAVGPIVLARNVTEANQRDLSTCYTRSLDLAKEHGLRSIAFPCISTAIYGYPIEEATQVALGAISYWLLRKENAESIDKVVFCVFSGDDQRVYRDYLLTYFDIYFDHDLFDFVTTDRNGAAGYDDNRASRMTVVVDSVSYCRPSYSSLAVPRPLSEVPARVSTPWQMEGRRSQPPKWPQYWLDLTNEELQQRLAVQLEDPDEEKLEDAQRFLREQEARQARKRAREAAEAEAPRPPTGTDTFHTPMEVDDFNERIQAVEIRTKKTAGQRELQAAFRTSFKQAKLMEAVRGRAKRFVPTERDFSIDGEEQPPPIPAHAVTVDEHDDDATTGRMSRLSLHEADVDTRGFVTPSASSTPTKTQDAFASPIRPISLYSSSTPTKAQHALSPTTRPLSLHIPSQTPTKTKLALSMRSPSASPRTQDAFPAASPSSSTPSTPKKLPLKTALKTMKHAASSIAKAALPGLGTSKAYKEFQKAAAEEKDLRTLASHPPPAPRQGMPNIPEESDPDSVEDTEREL